jgi:hypothetical protein
MEAMNADPEARASATRRPLRPGYVVQLTGPLDRHEAEALQIEIRALAKRHRLAIGDISVRRVTTGRSA